ncbi:MAG: hypothetical protein K0Q95_1949 [Bacteroidota bacterium]|jgi:hypothetical protein|nr:hypothetical protein [Bacteroidota bacterium]
MKKLSLLLLVCFTGASICAQTLVFKPTTGDTEMDGVLKEIDAKAKKDIAAFNNTVATNFNIGRGEVEQAVKEIPPGDVFMAAQMSSTLNKPFPTVVEAYKANKDKGWGAIAKEMGIKPGSAEFHEMKKSLKSNSKKKKDKGKDKSKGNTKAEEKPSKEISKKK